MRNLKKEYEYLGATSTHITEFYPPFVTDTLYIEDVEK